MRRPIYQDEYETYRADTCRGLIEGAAAGQVRLEALVHGHYPGRPLPRGALPGVKTVGFWDAVADQGWGLDWHRNEGIELTFLESGRLEFAVDGSFGPRVRRGLRLATFFSERILKDARRGFLV